MSISATKSPETASFAAKLLHHKERDKYSPDNIPNLTNPLDSNIEEGNDNFTSKEATSQPARLDFVESTRKEIGSHKIDKHWTLVRRRYLNGKNKLYLYGTSIKRAPDGRLIKPN